MVSRLFNPLALASLALLATACSGPEDTGKTDDSSEESGTDESGETETAETEDTNDNGNGNGGYYYETGLGVLAYTGYVNAPGATFSDGGWGYSLYGFQDETWVCTVLNPVSQSADPSMSCDDCVYSYGLVAESGPVSTGKYCSFFQKVDWAGFEYGLGWNPDVVDYEFSNGTFAIEDLVFLYYQFKSGPDWILWGFNYPAYYIYNTYATDDYAGFTTLAYSGNSSSPYLYYYYGRY